jgi:small basic protein
MRPESIQTRGPAVVGVVVGVVIGVVVGVVVRDRVANQLSR